jgi:tRNA G10  N-methylase Trm11
MFQRLKNTKFSKMVLSLPQNFNQLTNKQLQSKFIAKSSILATLNINRKQKQRIIVHFKSAQSCLTTEQSWLGSWQSIISRHEKETRIPKKQPQVRPYLAKKWLFRALL